MEETDVQQQSGSAPLTKEEKKERRVRRTQLVMSVIIPIYYIALLVVALVFYTTHKLDSTLFNDVLGFAGTSEGAEAVKPIVAGAEEAYAAAVWLLMACMTPSLILYYAAASPYKINVKIRKALFGVGVVAMIGAAIAYIVSIFKYVEIYADTQMFFAMDGFNIDMLIFVLSIIVGNLAFILYYALCMRTKPARGKLGKVLGLASPRHPILGFFMSIVLTVLLPIIGIIIVGIVILLVGALLALFLLLALAGGGGGGVKLGKSNPTITVDGYERELHKTAGYKWMDGKQMTVYTDDLGEEWLSSDGKKFYKA